MRSLEGQVLELIQDGKALHHGLCIGERSDKGKKFVGRFVDFLQEKAIQAYKGSDVYPCMAFNPSETVK